MEARIKMLENAIQVLRKENVRQDEDAFKDLLSVAMTLEKLERRIARLEGLAGDGEKSKDKGGTPPTLDSYIASLLKSIQN